jgi:peptidyl-tRNA hydrolase
MLKMYAIFARETLALFQGNEGKLAAQAGHAYLHAFWDAEELADELANQDVNSYAYLVHAYKVGMDARKIALVVDTVEELRDIEQSFIGFAGTSLVEDCGYTIFKEPTITCLGIGPIDSSVPNATWDLSLLRHELYDKN